MGIACLLSGSVSIAQEHAFYGKSVKPVLQSRCYPCHGALKQEAGLRLDTVAFMQLGSENGPVIQPGDAANSLLMRRVTEHEESIRMPPEGEALSRSQIEAISTWLKEGAHHPPDEPPERDPKDHWAFRPPVRSPVPQVAGLKSNNPIDAFLSEPQAAKKLVPQSAANPRIWLRRVSLDLIGVPPTQQQLDAFALDPSEETSHRLVDTLLASPRHGERWGRHWMDIWRYSDWWGLGEEVRNSQKHMWHWRDWIVESLNEDVGYDEMVRQMLAADELYPNDLGKLRASGFLARQYFKFNRTSWLDETVEHTSKAMLGLTFNCCKCHDHKYDPLSQEDYYRLRAVFEPYQVRAEMVPGIVDFQKDGIPRAFDCNLDAPTFVHARGDDRTPITSQPMIPSVPALLRWEPLPIVPVSLPREAFYPSLRTHVMENYLADRQSKVQNAELSLEAAKKKLAEGPTQEQAKLELAVAERSLRRWALELEAVPLRFAADRAKMTDDSAEQRSLLAKHAAAIEKRIAVSKAEEEVSLAELTLFKANPQSKDAPQKKLAAARSSLETAIKQKDAPGEEYVSMRGAEKSAESNVESEESKKREYPRTSTGRRSALATWLTDRRNPLAARVAVNHIWTRHFGRPLVPTVFDFGRKGTSPIHPELLDWLAVELMDHQWSMKHIHRLIVHSEAYRRSSSNAGSESNLATDRDNQYYWRMNSTRMESQVVRDSLLSLAEELDGQMGGPTIPAADQKSRRRSLYFFHSHNEHNPLLSAFDDANVLDCYRRGESIVPQQALALENSVFAMEMADRLATRMQTANANSDQRAFIRLAFVAILADEPTPEELDWIERMMERMEQASSLNDPAQRMQQVRSGLIRGLINHNDFITVR